MMPKIKKQRKDRKNLSDLAVKEPKTFEFIAKKAKEVFGKKA